ncbi:hypothetical protein WA026_000301 [Henosepilachna vigintioctopunctata]|uniref:Myosin motor domain-containing protein n=1 Tax=Henosepilachna vigintioctopunctata TaxID=420089 RepID=A0AAW1V6U2_9CUCU
MTKVRDSSLDFTEVNRTSSKFRYSIELLRKETDLLNGCDRNIAKYFFINNVCDLEDKSPENVAGLIKYRFFKKQIYTWTGQTLIAVQPYERNVQKKVDKDNDPNICSVVSRAWFNLSNRLGKINQCIVISGDSGSGKTYSACVALKYLGTQPQICDLEILNNVLYKTWSSVSLLAAFGNASTFHNTNSSRFGRLIQIQCRNGKIVGAFIRTFLLERSRVSGPNRAETNFHIFHQALCGVDESTLENVYLSKKTEYKICPKIAHHPYCSYSETLKAMKFLQITQIDDILCILSLILNLGNIDFAVKDEKLIIPQDCKQYVNFCSKILLCNTTSLSQLLLKRLVAPRLRKASLCYTSCVNVEECQERKNSFMRFLYDSLFHYLVTTINNQIFYEKEHDCLGILDIYGFESFFLNTFEQLCINYANERLQQYYIQDYFKKQMNYAYEKYEKITKFDLSKYNERINLLDGSLSVFGILNEECLVKRYNTDIFIGSRLSNSLSKNEFFIARSDSRNTKFSIKHYAGTVEYDCRSMVNKNRDKIPEEMILLLNETKFEFLRQVVSSRSEDIQYLQGKTLLSKFKKSLDNLMATLDKADVHYVKCLKPNQKQIGNFFDEEYFIKQLEYNGIMDTLKLEFQLYSIVIAKNEFSRRFGDQILEELKYLLKGKVYVGKDKIYFSENSFGLILKYQSILMLSCVRRIQRYWKAKYKKRNQAATKIQRCFRRSSQMNRSKLNDTLDSTLDGITVIENVNFKSEITRALEDIEIKSKVPSRKMFKGDRIVSRQRIAQVPVRCHIKKTCIPFSYVLPIQETPSGLIDIF